MEPLRRALEDRESSVRIAALRALGETGAPAALEPLCRALRKGSSEEQLAAADSLGNLGDPHAIGPLRDALQTQFVGRTARRQLAWGFWLVVSVWIPVLWALWGDPHGFIGSFIALSIYAIMVLISRQFQSRQCRVIAEALARLAERNPTPELRALLSDLRVISSDVVLQQGATRAAAREAARRIERLTERLQSLPVPAGAPGPDPEKLPRPAEAPARKDAAPGPEGS